MYERHRACLCTRFNSESSPLDQAGGRMAVSTSAVNEWRSSAPARQPSNLYRSLPSRRTNSRFFSERQTSRCLRIIDYRTCKRRPRSKNYRAFRANGRAQPIGWDTAGNERTAEEHPPDEIRTDCERRWEMGGLYFYGTFADLLVGKEANDIVAEFVRGKIRERVKTPNWPTRCHRIPYLAASGFVRIQAISKLITEVMSRW